jgi:hypothetical protein
MLPSIETRIFVSPKYFGNLKLFFMENVAVVLDAMKKAGVPLNAGKLVELTGLDRKEVDKAMKQLKADGAISSPKMCYWEPSK